MTLLFTLLVAAATLGAMPLTAAQEQEQAKANRSLSLTQSIAVGGLSGATEVIFPGQPLSYLGNMKMLKKPTSFKPTHLYTGFWANFGGMVPLTALQKLVRTEGELFLQQRQSEELSTLQKSAVGFMAGAVAATIATPSEAIPVYQQLQKAQGTPKTTKQAFLELQTRAWRGLTMTAIRDGLFTAGYGALASAAKEAARTEHLDENITDLTAGVTTGLGIAFVTHPATVIRAQLQEDFAKKHYATSFDAAKALYKEGGFKRLFKGLEYRSARIAVAIPFLAALDPFYTSMMK